MGGVIYPVFVDPQSKTTNFETDYASALAIRNLGEHERIMGDTEPPPCGAGLTGRTDVLKRVLCNIGLHLTDRKGLSLSSGGDSEIGLLVRRLGWETWYTPALKMGHLLPPHRLTPSYLRGLHAGFRASASWLSVLGGRSKPRSRFRYLYRALRSEMVVRCCQIPRLVKSVSLSSERRSSEEQQRLIAQANWALVLDNPFPKVMRRIQQEIAQGGGPPA